MYNTSRYPGIMGVIRDSEEISNIGLMLVPFVHVLSRCPVMHDLMLRLCGLELLPAAEHTLSPRRLAPM